MTRPRAAMTYSKSPLIAPDVIRDVATMRGRPSVVTVTITTSADSDSVAELC